MMFQIFQMGRGIYRKAPTTRVCTAPKSAADRDWVLWLPPPLPDARHRHHPERFIRTAATESPPIPPHPDTNHRQLLTVSPQSPIEFCALI